MLHRYPCGLAQGVGQRIEVEVIQLLAGDHRDGLRGFLDGQVQASGSAHRAGGVGLGVLGSGTQAFGGDAGAAQLQHGVFGVGFGQQFRAQHHAEQANGEGHGAGKRCKHCGRLLVFVAFSIREGLGSKTKGGVEL